MLEKPESTGGDTVAELRRRLADAERALADAGRSDARMRRINRLYLVLSRIGDAVVRIRDRVQLYDRACRIAVEEGGMQMALITELDLATREVRVVTGAGASSQFLQNFELKLDGGPRSHGTIGTAFRTGSHDVCNDFMNDARMAPWREGIDGMRFRSGGSFPINVGGTTVGVLAMLSSEAGYFQEDEIELMVAVADDLSFAVESLQKEQQRQWAEAALRASEAGMALAQSVGHFGSWELDLDNLEDVDANPLRWSDEMYRIAGFEPSSVAVDNALFFQLVPADEHQSIREAMQEAIAQRGTYSIVHRLVRQSGDVRIVRETAEVLVAPDSGRAVRLVGTSHDITERRQVQESLRLQAHALDSIGQAVIATAVDGRITYANRAAGELYGWPTDTVVGRHIDDATIASDARDQARTIILGFSRTEIWSVELPMQRSDGTRFPAWVTNSPLRDIDGSIIGHVAVSFDISERKRADLEIARQAGRLAALVEAQQTLTSTEASVDELIAMVPGMAQRLLGADAAVYERLEGEEMFYQHTSGLARGFEGMRLRLDSSLSGEAIRLNQTLISDDTYVDPRVDTAACRRVGARSMVVTVLRTEAGPFGAIKIFAQAPNHFSNADASSLELLAESLGVVIQRRLAVEQLRASERQYRLLFDTNPQPMWAFDIQTLGFLTVNEAAVRHYGYAREEFLAMDIRQIRPSEDIPAFESSLREIPPGKSFGLWRHQKKNGELIDVEVSADDLMFNGRQARLVLAHDVTIRLRAERKLKRSLVELSARNRELQDFAFIASHDLQEPLRKVRAFADRLIHGHAPQLNPQGVEYLERMSGAVSRMQRLIDALLDYSRVLSHARPLVPVDLNIVLRGVLEDLEVRLRDSAGSVELSPLPTVFGDASLLGQVFQNLIANALKFHASDRPPQVRLSVQSSKLNGLDAWQIDVVDNGIGFAAEFSEKIFAPFQRLHGREVYDGTGIGLAIVRRILERYGGAITAEGRAGQGASFHVWLPKQAPVHLLEDLPLA